MAFTNGGRSTATSRASHSTTLGNRDTPVLPTGEQFTIRRGSQEAVVTEVGATLRKYTVEGNDVVDPFPENEISDSHGQILIPFPNRVAGGSYDFEGTDYTLPINQPTEDATIHGFVRFLAWTVEAQAGDSITLANTLWPTPGYPFPLESKITYRLGDKGLTVQYKTTNIGTGALPIGIGHHPYFTVGTPTVDNVLLTVPADTMLITDDNGIPTGSAPVDGTPFDFREPRAIGATVLDNAYTDLIRDASGIAAIMLESPDGQRKVEVQLGAGDPFVQIYSADTLPDPATHRRSLAVEPMTCPANAFNSGDGLIVLRPGEAFDVAWTVTPSPV